MQSPRRHVFYGDLNCPFCFVQNERVMSMGLGHLIEWRGVEHSPHLPLVPKNDPNEHAEILRELERLGPRAPDVEVRDPGFRPNTKLALTELIGLPDADSARARQAVYRALWQEGVDISDRAALARVLASFPPPTMSIEDRRRTLREWTRQWSDGPFDRRIPSVAARTGETLLGMAAADTLRSFVWLKQGPGETPEDAC